MSYFNSSQASSNPESNRKYPNPKYTNRKDQYRNKLGGELEAYVYRPMEEWTEAEFDKVFELLNSLDQELQEAYSCMLKECKQKECQPEPKSTKKCILCGKETTGSIGRAGIKWSMICQPCKDREDDALSRQLDASGQAIKKLINGLDDFSKWLEGEDSDV